IETPARERPTIERRDTAPPRRAITRASLKDFKDPAADRTFVRIATCIPMKPERAEKAAPRAKAPAVFRPSSTAFDFPAATAEPKMAPAKTIAKTMRSEERRVGKSVDVGGRRTMKRKK